LAYFEEVLPVFIKIYFDAGWKELASKHHRGATLKVLTECSKFAITHILFVQAWEAILRHQIASFFAYISSGQPFDVEISALVLHIVTEILDGQTENTDMTGGQPVIDEWKQICENKDKVFSVFTDEILQ
jgi:hypothetical protein